MNELMYRILEGMVQSAALMLTVLALRRALGHRLDARVVYALWLLPLGRMLLPALPVGGWLPGGANGLLSIAMPSAESLGTAVSLSDAVAHLPGAVRAATVELLPHVNTDPNSSPLVIGWRELLMAAWLAGVLAVLGVALARNLRFARRYMRGAQPLGRRGRARVYAADVRVPCMAGVLRPAILMPRSMERGGEYDMMLEHELTHMRHGDDIWALLRLLALAVWWFNPLAWLCARLSMRDCELACDRSLTRAMDAQGRTRYGMLLLRLAAEPAGALSTVAGMSGEGRIMKERIMNIARERRTSRAALALALALLMAALPLCFTGTAGAEDAGGARSCPVSEQDYFAALDAPYGDTTILPMLAWMIEWQTGLGPDEYSLPLDEVLPHESRNGFSTMSEDELRERMGELYDQYDLLGRRSQDGMYAYILARSRDDYDELDRAASISYYLLGGGGSKQRDSGEGDYHFDGVRHVESVFPGLWVFSMSEHQRFDRLVCHLGRWTIYEFTDAYERGYYTMEPWDGLYLRADKYLRSTGERVTCYIPVSEEEHMQAMLSSRVYTPDELGGDAALADAYKRRKYAADAETDFISAPLAERMFDVLGVQPVPDTAALDIVSATMRYSATEGAQTVTDPDALAGLERIIRSATRFTGEDGAHMPYIMGGYGGTGLLELELADGGKLSVMVGEWEDCDMFVLGDWQPYTTDKADIRAIWQTFGEIDAAVQEHIRTYLYAQ